MNTDANDQTPDAAANAVRMWTAPELAAHLTAATPTAWTHYSFDPDTVFALIERDAPHMEIVIPKADPGRWPWKTWIVVFRNGENVNTPMVIAERAGTANSPEEAAAAAAAASSFDRRSHGGLEWVECRTRNGYGEDGYTAHLGNGVYAVVSKWYEKWEWAVYLTRDMHDAAQRLDFVSETRAPAGQAATFEDAADQAMGALAGMAEATRAFAALLDTSSAHAAETEVVAEPSDSASRQTTLILDVTKPESWVLSSQVAPREMLACVRALMQSPGLRALCMERVRQIETEGYDAAHDANHPGEMATAGAHYAFNAGHAITGAYEEHERAHVPAGWPWGTSAWKPKDPQRDLERSGALIAAELDRIARATASGEG